MTFTQAIAATGTPTLQQATSAAKSTNKPVGAVAAVWANENVGATDTLVRQAAFANSYTMLSDANNKMVVFELTPDQLDVNGGYTWLYVTMGASAQATNFVSAVAYLAERYQQATPPTAIV